MKEKLKNINLASIVSILKSSLLGVVASILLVLVFAFVLKFVDLSSNVIGLVDQIIKIISIVVAVIALNKSGVQNLLLKSILTGAVYSIFTFIVFSLLNGGMIFSIGLLPDVLFSAMVAGACSIATSLIAKK